MNAPQRHPSSANDHVRSDSSQLGYANWKFLATMLIVSQGISLLGSEVVQYAMVWHITLTTKSGTAVALAVIFGFLPRLILSPIAGVWADRYNRRMLAVTADVVVALATVGIMVAFLTGHESLPLIYLVLGLRSAGGAIQNPAVSAMIPQFVPQDQLVRVNGFFGSFQAVTAVLAPAIAGVLMASSPLGYIFLVDLVTAVIGISLFLAFVRVRQDHVNPDDRTGQWSELKDGFRYLVRHEFLGRFMAYSVLGAFFASPLLVVVNLHMVRMFGDEPWRLSVMEAIFGVALIVGGLFVGLWPGFKRETTTIGAAMLIMSVFVLAMAWAPHYWLYVLLFAAAGLFLPYESAPTTALIQRVTDQRQVGRMLSISSTFAAAVFPLGAAVSGPLADAISISYILAASAVALCVIGFVFLGDSKFRKIPPIPRR